MKKLFLSLSIFLILAGCTNTNTANPGVEKKTTTQENSKEVQPASGNATLQTYIDSHSELSLGKDLIACAMGGEKDFMTTPEHPISVFFYPLEGATDFRYFETALADSDPEDLSLFEEKDFEIKPVFNGYLQRFLHTGVSDEVWGRVSYVVGDDLHISSAIRMRLTTTPTEYTKKITTIISEGEITEPVFKWEDPRAEDNAIYFQVLSDEDENLISGTYTRNQRFKFNDFSNVEINIRDITPPPKLNLDQRYIFTLMGVSEDNWVHLVTDTGFKLMSKR